VSYLERAEADRDYISNQYRPRDLRALSGPDLQFGDGEEHRHNFTGYGEGYGHVMLLQLRELVRPVSIGSGIMKAGPDWPPLRRGIQKARREGATVIWCHNDYGMEDTPNWLAGLVQAHNIFDGGHHGSYRDTFYRYLNLGLKVPFSTGTDWFLYDYSRAYVRLEGPPTAARWLQGLTQGRSYITNSPLLEFRVEEREIGETIRLAGPRSVRVEGRAVGRHDFRQVDVVQNGVVVRSAPSRRVGGHFEAELRFDLPITGPGWLALKVAGEGPGAPREVPSLPRNEFGEALFGHTSPVYLEFAGRTIFQPEAAAGFLREMEQSLRVISEKGQFETSAQREEVLAIYQEAIAGLRRRSEREGRRLPSSDQSGR